MLYWLDDQIDGCVRHAEKLVGAGNVLSILTSDHGVPPIPEEAYAKGLTNSVRLDASALIEELNQCIKDEFGIPHAVHDIKNSALYFSNTIRNMPRAVKQKLCKRIQKQLHCSPYITHAWLPDEIATQLGPVTTIPYRIKRQFFSGRSGDIIIETRPYVLLTMKKTGVGHNAPYTYNTHVPLFFLWPEHLQRKAIDAKVTTTQLAPTLAKILAVPQPAGAEDGVLPEM
jgi:arylsulfatase A-like enzyme